MFDKRKNVIASVTTIGTIAILLAGCTNYDDVFEDNFGYGQSSKGVEFNGSTLKDLRDNHTYDVAQVGSLYWMMQDLSYEYYSTGKDYYLITACPKMYVKDEPNCDETGFLYPGQRLEHACPEGWRLPDVYEWQTFYNSSTFKKSSRSSYKGYIGGDKSQNKYGEAAYYWASTLFGTGSYKDCVSFTSEEDSFESVGRCHEQWKLAVRCVKETGSELTTSSSSRADVDVSFPCGDLWCGATDTEGRVKTGSEEPTAGWWYDFSDQDDGGNSEIVYPSDVKMNESGFRFESLVNQYMGIIGSFVLGEDYEYAYVGFGFNLFSENQEGMDITDWGGICLVYESTWDISLQLVPEHEAEVTEYNNYRFTVLKTSAITVVDIPWDNFRQLPGWGLQVDLATILSDVAAIKLRFEGEAGESGDFYIHSIGRLGTCN